MNWPWSELGLTGPADLDTVKHAYAERLKTTHPEDDPDGFQCLHKAYQTARRLARMQRPGPMEQPEPEEGEAEGSTPEGEAFDFKELLAQEEPKPKEEGFDFEKLFKEGDEERRDAQRRRTEERLRAAQERRTQDAKIKQDAALASEEAWNAAFTALHAVEVLYNAGVPVDEWVRFLHSSTFLDAQHNLDFIFGLEDFLTEHPQLPEDIKRKIFLAYNFYRGKPPAMYLGLYRLLLDSYRNAGRANRGIERGLWRQRKPNQILMVVMSVLILLVLLTNGGHFYGSQSDNSGSADTAYSDLRTPTPETGTEATDRRVPLEGGEEDEATSFHSLVISCAPQDFPGIYAVIGRGTAENDMGTFDWIQCKGQDASGEELIMNYYLSEDGKSLYCIPDSKSGEMVEMECTHTWRGISVYRCVEG